MARTKKIGISLISALFIMALISVLSVSAASDNDFSYSINDDGELVLTAFSSEAEELTIPEELNGQSVSVIGNDFFSGHEQLKDIFIPDTVTAIEENAAAALSGMNIYAPADSFAAQFAQESGISFTALEQGSYARITLEKSDLTIKSGSSAAVKAKLFPEYGYEKLTLTSDDTNVATIGFGRILAMKKGKTSVTVSCNNVSAKCSVTVSLPVKSVTAPDSFTLGTGERMWLNYKTAPAGAETEKLSITSSNEKAASFSNGRIIANSPGTANIIISYENKVLKKIVVNVTNAPEKVYLSATSIEAGTGETFQIYSYVTPGSTDNTRKYETSNSKVAAVVKKGWQTYITAVAPGVADITVRTYNGKSAVCRVTVKNAPKSASFNKKQITIGTGESYRLQGMTPDGASYAKTYYSGNNKIAVIDKSGVVTALRTGTTQVAIKTYNGRKGYCTVIVKASPQSVSLGRNKLTLEVGESYILNSRITEGSASSLRQFTSSNSSIVRVDPSNWNGKIIAVKEGTARITVRTYNGKYAQCIVKVVTKSERKKILNQATKWLGYNEIDGSYKEIFDVYNKGRIPGTYFMRGLDPWCATYVSAVFMKAGMVSMIYPSCSCPTMVRGAISMDIWQENDAYVPERGDLIFYNWDDNGIGDCKTGAYHVGIITDVNFGVMTVIEGNHDDNDKNGDDFVAYRRVQINDRFIRGFITPKYKN